MSQPRKPGRPPWTEQQWKDYNQRQTIVQAAGDEYNAQRGIGRREFLKKAGSLGAVGALGAFAGGLLMPASGLDPQQNWVMQAGSPASPPDYTIFDDGTGEYFARNGITGSVKDVAAQTDFGALFNSVIALFPAQSGNFYEKTGGWIHIKKSQNHYFYSTTPLINKSWVVVTGSGRGTTFEPTATVDGFTIQSPAGAGLLGPEIRNLGFYDPSAKGVGKAYIKIDPNTNVENITHGIIDNIHFWGGPNAASSTGKLIQQIGNGSGAFGLNGTVADFIISNIMAGSNFLQYAGSAPNLPMYASDSILDFQAMFDCTFQNWLVAFHNYQGTVPWLKAVYSGAFTHVSSGNEYYNLKWLTDSTTSALTIWLFDNVLDNYFEDMFLEIGSVVAGTIGLELAHDNGDNRFRRLRIDNGDIGVQFDANATHTGVFGADDIFYEPMITRMGTALKSIAGDASIKSFYGGVISGTTFVSPDPFTGAQFFKVSRATGGGYLPGWGWIVTTPGLPGGIGIGNAVQNLTTVPIIVYQTGMTGTHIIDANGTDTNLGLDPTMIRLAPLDKVYYATAIPGSWKWYGD